MRCLSVALILTHDCPALWQASMESKRLQSLSQSPSDGGADKRPSFVSPSQAARHHTPAAASLAKGQGPGQGEGQWSRRSSRTGSEGIEGNREGHEDILDGLEGVTELDESYPNSPLPPPSHGLTPPTTRLSEAVHCTSP